MSKTIKTSTGKKKTTKEYSQIGPFYFYESVPVSDDFLNLLAEEYVEWGIRTGEGKLEEQSFILSDFLDEKNIPTRTFRLWLERNERLRIAHELVKRRIGARREKSSFLKNTSESIFLLSAPMYSESWDQNMDYKILGEWKSSLQDKERDQQAQNFIIQMPSFRDTDEISNDNSKEKSTPKE